MKLGVKNVGRLLLSICLLVMLLPLNAFVAFATTATATVAEPEFRIVYPSVGESMIAPGRDFYVIGTASKAQLADKRVTIELFQSGASVPVRSLTWQEGYSADYSQSVLPLDNCYDGGLTALEVAMPDLVYDTRIAGSGQDGNRKIAVTENNFCALILGGANDDGLTSQGEKLTAGRYTIKVTLATGESVSRDIVLGDTPHKVISRYAPSSHYQRVEALAKERGLRMYVDPFPGYWSPGNMEAGSMLKDGAAMTGDVFLENLSRWRYADGLEYETGTVHLFLYNIGTTSASQSVEIAALQRSYRIDSSQLVCYYYDIGEPTLSYRGTALEGELTQMSKGDKLELTRAQMGEAAQENHFLAYAPVTDGLDTNLADGVTASEGAALSLFGVVAPLQNTSEQIRSTGKNAYAMSYGVDAVRYTFSQNGVQIYQTTRSVGLDREYTAGKKAQSLYEFRHVFPLGGDGMLTEGRFEVTAEALDSLGQPVLGGSERFTLVVDTNAGASVAAAADEISPKTGDESNAGMTRWLLVALLAAAVVLVTVAMLNRRKRA